MVHKVAFICIAIIFMTVGITVPASATPSIGTIEGMVLTVQDGDHLTITNDGTEFEVRLYGIRAPKMAKTDASMPGIPQASQPYAEKAFAALTKKVLHKNVKLEIMRIDRHDRTVAVIWIDGRDVNLEMVTEGLAWASQKNKDKNHSYIQAEKEARDKRLGLWSQDSPEPPWEFKKRAKAKDNNVINKW